MPAEFVEPAAAHKFLFDNRAWFNPEAKRRLNQFRWANQHGQHRCRISDATALRWASDLLQRQPQLAKKLKTKDLRATPCVRCGTLLSAPESIAAGIGPECMAK